MKQYFIVLVLLVLHIHVSASGPFYVTLNGGGDGSSWDSPTTLDNVQGKLDAYETADVYVKAETYESKTYIIVKNITIYGGFDGESSPDLRKPNSKTTFLSSRFEITSGVGASIDGFSFTRHPTDPVIFISPSLDNQTFNISNCTFTQDGGPDLGTGYFDNITKEMERLDFIRINNLEKSVVLNVSNCSFSNNVRPAESQYWAVISNIPTQPEDQTTVTNNGGLSLTIDQSLFNNLFCRKGIIDMTGTSSNKSSLTINNTKFLNNYPEGAPVLMLEGYTDYAFSNSLFANNQHLLNANLYGISKLGEGTGTITNCTFVNNKNLWLCYNATISNCIFYDQEIRHLDETKTFNNNYFYFKDGGSNVYSEYNAILTVGEIPGNTIELSNIPTVFVNPLSNYHLHPLSPAKDKGTDVGITTDLDGNLRDAKPDIGAYETSDSCITLAASQNVAIPYNSTDFSSYKSTIRFWMRADAIDRNDKLFVIKDKSENEWITISNDASGMLYASVGGAVALPMNKKLFPGEWIHIGITANGSLVTFYVNGKSNVNFSSSLKLDGTQGFAVFAAPSAARISVDEFSLWDSPSGTANIPGSINQSLSGNETELKTLFNFNNRTKDSQTGGYWYSDQTGNGTKLHTESVAEPSLAVYTPVINVILIQQGGFGVQLQNDLPATTYFLSTDNLRLGDSEDRKNIVGNYCPTGYTASLKVTTDYGAFGLKDVEIPRSQKSLVLDANSALTVKDRANPLNGLNTYTVETWFKPTADGCIFDLAGYGSGIMAVVKNNVLAIIFYVDGSFKDKVEIPVLINAWSHLAIVSDAASAATTTVYLNGIEVAKLGLTPITKAFQIGSGSDGYEKFTGELDEFRVWGVAQTLPNILASIYAPLAMPANNLLLYYNFDNYCAADVHDVSGNGHDGMVENTLGESFVASTAMNTPCGVALTSSEGCDTKLKWEAMPGVSTYTVSVYNQDKTLNKSFPVNVNEAYIDGLVHDANYIVGITTDKGYSSIAYPFTAASSFFASSTTDLVKCEGQTLYVEPNKTNFNYSSSWTLPDNTESNSSVFSKDNAQVSDGGKYTYVRTWDYTTCKDSIEYTVTVNPLPTVNAIPDTVLAIGSTTISQTISDDNDFIGASISEPNMNVDIDVKTLSFNPTELLSQKEFTLTVANSNNCTNTETFSLTVVDALTITIDGTKSICANESVSLTATVTGGSAEYTYSWTDDNGLVLNETNSLAYDNGALSVGDHTFTLTATDKTHKHIVASKDVIVTVKILPEITIKDGYSFCQNAPATITPEVTDGSTIAWSASQYLTSPLTQLAQSIYTEATTEPVELTITATLDGCSIEKSTTLSITPLDASADFTLTSPRCEGELIEFEEKTGNYFIDGALIENYQFEAKLTKAENKQVFSIKHSIGSAECPNNLVKELTVYANPTVSSMAKDTEVCKTGESLNFKDQQGVFLNNKTKFLVFDPITADPQSQIVYQIDNDGNCLVEKRFTITVNDPQKPLPQDLNWTNDQTDNDVIAQTLNTVWYNSDNAQVGVGSSFKPNLSVPGRYTFYCTEKIGNCESERADITILVQDANCPKPQIEPLERIVCQNDLATFSSNLSSTVWYSSLDRNTVVGEGSSITRSTGTSGTFTYYAMNVTSCKSDSVEMTLIVNPLPEVDLAQKVIVSQNSPAILSANTSAQEGLYAYSWSPASSLVTANTATVQALLLAEDTEFTLTVTNVKTQCITEKSVMVTPLEVVVPLTAIVLPASAGYNVGDQMLIAPAIFPADATDPELIWSSSNTAVATVDATGRLIALSAGIAEIRASNRSNTVSAIMLATVNDLPVMPTGISLPDSVVLQLSAGSYQFAPIISPFNATAPVLAWSTLGTTVLQIDALTGAVKLLNTGTETVTVSIDGTDLSAQCNVHVRSSQPVQQIKALPVLYVEAGATEKFFTIASYFTDDNTAPADISIKLKNNEPATLSISNVDGKAIFTGMAIDDSLAFTILFQDADGNVTEAPAILVVLDAGLNQAPIIATVTDQSKSGENYSQIVLADLVIDDFTMPENINWVTGGTEFLEAEIVDGMLTVKPKTGDWVTDTLALTAVDIHGQKTIIQIVYNNSTFNKAPQIRTIDDQVRNERSDFAPIYLNAHISDDNTAPADIRWLVSPTKRLKITITNQVAAIEIADKSWIGTEIVRFTAIDAKGLAAYTNVVFSQLRQPEVPVSGGFFFADFTASRTTAARGSDIRLYADMKGAAFWKWLLDGSPISQSDSYNPLVSSRIAGRHTVSLIVSDGEHFDTVTKPFYLNFVGIRENAMVLCKGNSFTFHASDPTFDKYEWSNTVQAPSAVYSPESNTYVSLSITDILFTYRDSIMVWVLQPMNVGSDTAICTGSQISLAPHISPQGANLSSYLWSTGSVEKTISASSAGPYSLTATDSYGCRWVDTMHITQVFPLPDIDLGPDTEYCNGFTVQLNAGNAPKYLWSTGAIKPTISIDTSGAFSVTITDANTCQNSDTVNLTFLKPYPEPLSLVTFNDKGDKFIAVWERTPGKRTQSYELMAEKGGPGRYVKLAERNYDELLYYVDSSSLATQQTYRYMLVTIDSLCNNRAESAPHRTMLISTSRGLEDTDVNIRFNAYIGIPVPEYIVYKVRGNTVIELGRIIEDGHAEYSFVHSAHQSGDRYRIAFELGRTIVLSSLKSESGPFSQSMSNLSEAIYLQSASLAASDDLDLFPNPAQCTVFIQVPAGFGHGTIRIVNHLGQSSLELPYTSGEPCLPIDLASLPVGTYTVILSNKDITARATVVRQ